MAEGSGKTATLTIGLWFDETAGDIHLRLPRSRSFDRQRRRIEQVREPTFVQQARQAAARPKQTAPAGCRGGGLRRVRQGNSSTVTVIAR